ncbi:MAG: sigma 54-interacting transcriptional regulator [Labilithrix sp.]|nr:sigma 54-interacting transcriptional regulator [Labilithrix sp.]MCW5810358.1 sigma 54-interacting transcriptional regulator [Labilithrix sp.]
MATTVFSTRMLEFKGGTLVHEGHGEERKVTIGPEPIVIGRDPACGLRVDETGVSAMHAEVVATPAGVRLRDLGSKNGTWVNDIKVGDVLLTTATSFSLARANLRFEPTKVQKFELPEIERFGPLYGSSAAMRDLFRRLERAAPTELTILVQGETGTGKELVAQAVHETSTRKSGPFVIVDCGSIAPTLAEATLFGHEKGAFTGAMNARVSPFIEANGGTIFLDELGELPLDVQPKLLRALAEKRVKAVGSNEYVSFDARVVAATRRDLESAVNAGTFRSDLYFRLAQVRSYVPALRQRLEDLPGLVRVMLEQLGSKTAWRRVTRATLDRLLRYDWPGNVRELKNAVAVALALADEGEPLDIAGALGLKAAKPTKGRPIDATAVRGYHDAKREALHAFERAYFAQLVEATNANVAEISRRTGLQRTHVRKYLRLHGLREPRGE